MKLHGNARTCPNSRRLLIERVIVKDWPVPAAAAAAGVSQRTVYRWLARFRQEARIAHPSSCRQRRSRRSARCASCE